MACNADFRKAVSQPIMKEGGMIINTVFQSKYSGSACSGQNSTAKPHKYRPQRLKDKNELSEAALREKERVEEALTATVRRMEAHFKTRFRFC
jgi:hypothetical protein